MIAFGRKMLAGGTLVVCVLAMPALACAAAGDLDPSFSTDGQRILDRRLPTGVTIDNQERAVISFFVAPQATVIRLTEPGKLDRTFGDAGAGSVDFGPGDDLLAALQPVPGGGYLLVGETSGSPPSLLAVGRLTASGQPDPVFGTGGVVTHSLGQQTGVSDAVLGSDGKLTVTGLLRSGNRTKWFVARLDSGGELDQTFSGDGWMTVELGVDAEGLDVALDGDGRAYVSGNVNGDVYSPSGLTVIRVLDDGTLDPAFAGDGSATVAGVANYQSDAMTVSDVGQVFVAGAGGVPAVDLAVAELSPSGLPVTSFGERGLALIDFSGEVDAANWAGIDGDGQLVVAGRTSQESENFGIARLTADGRRDASFGNAGVVYTPVGGKTTTPDEFATAAAFGPDGKLTAVGTFGSNGAAVSRYLTRGEGPRDRDGDGTPDSRDHCVDIYGQAHGCPRFESAVSIDYTGRKFRGRVRPLDDNCEVSRDRVVRLYRTRPGADRLIGTSDIHFYPSTWEVNAINRHGTYYAVASRTLDPSFGICAKARSPRVTIPEHGGDE